MQVFRSQKEAKEAIARRRAEGSSIGFVPTMGALHEGHLSLVRKSKEENDFTAVSIFVNPTQFNNSEDLEKYPRSETADLELLRSIDADAVYIPEIQDLYPNGEEKEHFEFGGLEKVMEGRFRPGHFDGVGTVVKRLFHTMQPDRAYFGEKDFQQLMVIRKLAELENLQIEIVGVPIKREEDGLAMSSRNLRLSIEMRREAPEVYRILKEARDYFSTHTPEETIRFALDRFSHTALRPEYFEITDEKSLQPLKEKNSGQTARAFTAVYAGEIRLIDNLRLD